MSQASTKTATELNISLEPHLIEVLQPLPTLLPPELAISLNPYLSTPPPPTIPYHVLHSISQWARKTRVPNFDPNAYTMISLLAGTRTSPERRFPEPIIPTSDVDGQVAISDRKAITALVNALLSIAGSGAASWWAAQRLSWRDEWKVLFALFVAIVVAIAEGVLYAIWQARSGKRIRRKVIRPTRHIEKTVSQGEAIGDSDRGEGVGSAVKSQDTLRQRIVPSGTGYARQVL